MIEEKRRRKREEGRGGEGRISQINHSVSYTFLFQIGSFVLTEDTSTYLVQPRHSTISYKKAFRKEQFVFLAIDNSGPVEQQQTPVAGKQSRASWLIMPWVKQWIVEQLAAKAGIFDVLLSSKMVERRGR